MTSEKLPSWWQIVLVWAACLLAVWAIIAFVVWLALPIFGVSI